MNQEPFRFSVPRRSLSGRRVPPYLGSVQKEENEDLTTLVQEVFFCLESVWRQMQDEQRDLLIEMSYTGHDRMRLSIELAQTFYQSGFPDLPREKLHRVMTEGELQSLLFTLVCGGTLPDMSTKSEKEENDNAHLPEVPEQPARQRVSPTSAWRSRRCGGRDPARRSHRDGDDTVS